MVWHNGDLIDPDDMRVSPFDLGLTVGLGVFETMAAYDGRVFAFNLTRNIYFFFNFINYCN